MHAPIAKSVSQNSVISKDKRKYPHKEEQISVAQTSESKPRRQRMRERFKTKDGIRRHRFAGWSTQQRLLGKHINQATCGNGGERWIAGALFDGYELSKRTVFQCHGSHWHGCVKCFLKERHRTLNNGKARGEVFFAIAELTRVLREVGYCVIEKWDKKAQDSLSKLTIASMILNRTSKKRRGTRPRLRSCTVENAHVPRAEFMLEDIQRFTVSTAGGMI